MGHGPKGTTRQAATLTVTGPNTREQYFGDAYGRCGTGHWLRAPRSHLWKGTLLDLVSSADTAPVSQSTDAASPCDAASARHGTRSTLDSTLDSTRRSTLDSARHSRDRVRDAVLDCSHSYPISSLRSFWHHSSRIAHIGLLRA